MGSGKTFKCEKCGYTFSGLFGIGMNFPRVYEECEKRAKSGELGEELRRFFKEHKHAALKVHTVALCCTVCGHLDTAPELSVWIPIDEKAEPKRKKREWTCGISGKYIDSGDLEERYKKVMDYPHKCEKCAGPMKIVMDHDELQCPTCKIPLTEAGHILWD